MPDATLPTWKPQSLHSARQSRRPQKAPRHWLGGLATYGGLRARYDQRGELGDLMGAVAASEQALEVTPAPSPLRVGFLLGLAQGLSLRYLHSRSPEDDTAATEAFRSACSEGLQVNPEVALIASRIWGRREADRRSWRHCTEALDYGIKASELLVREQLFRSGRVTWLSEAQGIHCDAAFAMAQAGRLKEAVTLQERGRARLLADDLERARADLRLLSQRELYDNYREAVERGRTP